MGGGSHDYVYAKIEEHCCGRMYNKTLNDLMGDIAKLMFEVEQCMSGDSSDEDYYNEYRQFHENWLKGKPQAKDKFIAEIKSETERLQALEEDE